LLQDFRGAILFISHDRLLIDRVATKVGELAEGRMHISEGGYDDYIEMKMARIGGLQRAYDAEAKRIRQLSASIGILAQKAFRGKEVAAYKKAKEELAALKQSHGESGRPEAKSTKIKLQGAETRLHNGKLLCRIKDLGFKYPEAKGRIFDKANLEVRSGDRIVLLGRNGSGKSTFLKCLTGKESPIAGEVVWADGVKWSYFDQHAEFDQDQTALSIVCQKLNLDDTEGRAALGAMRFDTHRMTTASKNLSGGERMRIRFALAFGAKPDFIILDEPTNHIDEVTWEILLEVCKKTKSSVLLVTHDYEFIKDFDPGIFWLIHGQTVAVRYKDLDELLDEIR
jgi:ATPase subunit of ABC transporter with duplicated ATPase domains